MQDVSVVDDHLRSDHVVRIRLHLGGERERVADVRRLRGWHFCVVRKAQVDRFSVCNVTSVSFSHMTRVALFEN